MDCIWESFEDKFRCTNCGFVTKNNRLHKNCPEKTTPPSLIKKAANFASALVNHVSAGLPQCTDDEVKARFDTCKSNECGFFNEEHSVCMHSKCGCFIRERGIFMDKLRWADSQCPVDKWKRIEK